MYIWNINLKKLKLAGKIRTKVCVRENRGTYLFGDLIYEARDPWTRSFIVAVNLYSVNNSFIRNNL